MAVDSTPLRASASRFALFRASLRLHRPPPTESAVPSPNVTGSQMVVPPGAAARSRAEVSRGKAPAQLDRVCRRSSGGAEVTAGDAVRMIARGAADGAVSFVCEYYSRWAAGIAEH